MNDYQEEISELIDVSKQKRKAKIYLILSLVSFILTLILAVFFPIPASCTDIEPESYIFMGVFAFFISMGLVSCWLFNKKSKTTLVEYEYSLKGEYLLVTYVYNRSRRKVLARIYFKSIYKIGKPTSDTFIKITANPDVKTYEAHADTEASVGKKLYYIAFKNTETDENSVCVIDVTDDLMKAVIRETGKLVIEDDFK
ncbi:MAG: hypothetical protein MJ072_01190 [Clostridia bacterium]|nr:hypothetical protein [Clostridia bacterium]